MNRLIWHRGPDEGGAYTSGGCAIGMRRLSIIDLSTGRQPIPNEDESMWIVFNGEIYNYQELRTGLEAKGHRFRTHSDTETILHLYEEEGVQCLEKLRGMFALAIWDERRQELFLARDRFGKKPLYYAHLEGTGPSAGFYFGSELKCLREAGVPMEIDADALRLYFEFTYIPEPHSAVRAVRKLAPGGWLRYRRDGRMEQGRYWRFPEPVARAAPGLTLEQAKTDLRDLFDDAVKSRLIADVPLGAFLSGGIDSSLVVASMAMQTGRPVKSFSIGFAESTHNELPYARMVAERYKTDHHEIVVRPDSADLINKIVRHFDEPFGDSSAIPTWIVSEFAARHVKVALSGDGGDELFGGYTRLFSAQRLLWADRVPRPLRRLLSGVSDHLPYSAYGKNWLHMISRPSAFTRYMENNTAPYLFRQRLYRPEWVAPHDEDWYRRMLGDQLASPEAGLIEQALYYETAVNLTGDMLVKVDRMSMANSLEVRSPLLDHRLGEMAAGLPTEWKMGAGGQGKKILIDSMADRLPPELLTREKQGFGIPLAAWFRNELRPMLEELLLGRRFLERGFVDPETLRATITEHRTGRRDNSMWLWSLLMLELWMQWMEQTMAVEP